MADGYFSAGAFMDSVEADVAGELWVPESRIRDSFSARQIGMRLLDNDRLRARERSRVQGLIDGTRPMTPPSFAF